MFSLLNGFYHYYTRKPSFNILIIGLDSSGKTTLLERIKCILSGREEAETSSTVPTVGLNVSKCNLNGVTCQFWDLGGGGDLPRLWPKYYSESHAVFFVINSENIAEHEEELKRTFTSVIQNEDVEGVPVAVLSNKLDLITDKEGHLIRVKELFNPLMSRIEARESKVFGVSALNGLGVLETLEWTLNVIGKNCTNRPPNFN